MKRSSSTKLLLVFKNQIDVLTNLQRRSAQCDLDRHNEKIDKLNEKNKLGKND